mgnify:CR=1 FL=1
MSLKSFHILFITIVSLTTIFVSYLFYSEWVAYNETKYLIFTILSLIFCVGLIFYSQWFLKEISKINAK